MTLVYVVWVVLENSSWINWTKLNHNKVNNTSKKEFIEFLINLTFPPSEGDVDVKAENEANTVESSEPNHESDVAGLDTPVADVSVTVGAEGNTEDSAVVEDVEDVEDVVIPIDEDDGAYRRRSNRSNNSNVVYSERMSDNKYFDMVEKKAKEELKKLRGTVNKKEKSSSMF